MSGLNLNAITENASRLGMRLQETFSEHTRDLALAKSPGLSYFDNTEDKLKNIRKQLESNSDREKLDAMKRLVAMISKGRPVPEYFPSVVKNVSTHNLEIRKLVYIYLLRYSSQEPDLALLSINTFQKDLSDPNPLIRAMALRVLSGINVSMIGGIVVMGIRKCASDISPYVRKAAALAVPKCYNLDTSHLPSLIQVLITLLRDRSPLSLGATAVAFEAVCPTRLDLLHPHYRRLCRTLVDMDEWGQVEMINLLIRYARTMISRPAVMKALDKSGNETGEEMYDVDPDLQLLLTCSQSLLHSRNSAVVLAVARAFYYISPNQSSSSLSAVVQPLLRLLTISKEVERVVLVYILVVARRVPALFANHYARFLIRSDDIVQTKELKIKVLLSVLNHENHQALLREFIDYAHDTDDALVSASIRAIGRVARLEPDCTQQCLSALLAFIRSKHDIQVSTAVLVLKSLVQSQSKLPASNSASIISTLAYRIDDIKHPQARACIIWLVGQYASDESVKEGEGVEGLARWAPDVLRKAVKGFVGEAPLVKLQTLTLAAKLLVLSPAHATLKMLVKYAFALARYDADFGVRDRARMLSALMEGVVPTLMKSASKFLFSWVDGEEEEEEERGGVVLRREQVRLVLFEGKMSGDEDDFARVDESTPLGTLSSITGKDMHGDSILPDWLEQGTEPSLRDTEEDMPQPVPTQALGSGTAATRSVVATPVMLTPTGGASPSGSVPKTGPGKYDDLERFYAEDEESEEEEEEEEEDEEEGEEEEGEEYEEEGEEGEEYEKGGEGHEESSEAEEDESEEEDEEEEHEKARLYTANLDDSGQAHW
ncbi:hypothetical protein NEOLEDRAFT_1055522 [Neolentinus lepideus HHB14362 ss-1]|uniref:AP complex subunit beta n=1 Tax=Neolentinus lepideus HHB14362 ss-1 TaxID=1314782 RepID=A0A165VNC1_9AGAM|nr:hypothetical protein NEOLEDRAFT_1055522 [Neolentinus lepideus HHB14362 ss-1]